jgi:predicted kinase
MKMKYLYIVRGPFGTGKTEFARTMCEHVISCWDYYAQYGENQWNEKLKPHADEYCRSQVKVLMVRGEQKIAVTNSFSKNEDLDYFYQLAQEHGYHVFCMAMDNRDLQEYKRDVPNDVVLKQILQLKNSMTFYQYL